MNPLAAALHSIGRHTLGQLVIAPWDVVMGAMNDTLLFKLVPARVLLLPQKGGGSLAIQVQSQ